DLAFIYGYESSEAFSRAFKKVHGENPSQVRKHQLIIKSFPKLTIQVSLKGDLPMNNKIQKKDGFTFYGITRNFNTEHGDNFKLIPKFWDEVMGNGDYQDMIKHSDNKQCIGVCMPMDSETGTKFDYIIGAFTDKPISGYTSHDVPEAEWAVFEVYYEGDITSEDYLTEIWIPITK
nr:effector binding domain-containing protein [Vallitaleaceae bacterium]